MRVSRAKRRWLRWGRYVAATQTRANRGRRWGTDIHVGQTKAHYDVMHARRYAPIGLRVVWYPRWVHTREENFPRALW